MVVSTGIICADYRMDEVHDSDWYDAEQGDTDLCWAAAASNALAWTSWYDRLKNPSIPPADTNVIEQDIFSVFPNYWSYGDDPDENGGLPQYAWEWWLKGLRPEQIPSCGAQIKDPANPGGAYFAAELAGRDFNQYFNYWGGFNSLEALKMYLELGYGVNLTAYPNLNDLGHAFTVWGYRYNVTSSSS